MAYVIGIVLGAVIGGLIGKDRKIGPVWGAVLGGLLGIIGWIIALCTKKNEA